MGAHTPACLRAASDPVETVTPPLTTPATKTCRWGPRSGPPYCSGDSEASGASRANWLVLHLWILFYNASRRLIGDPSPRYLMERQQYI
jgi:hypothetical protein